MKKIKDFLKSIIPIILLAIIISPFLYVFDLFTGIFSLPLAFICWAGEGGYHPSRECSSWASSASLFAVIIFSYLISHFFIWLLKNTEKK